MRTFSTLLLLTIATACYGVFPDAPDGNSVLILDPTVINGALSFEATTAGNLGYTVVMISTDDWLLGTTNQFAAYRALIWGDPHCVLSADSVTGSVPELLGPETNIAVWTPAVTGNVYVMGSDPIFHGASGGFTTTTDGIAFAASDTTTGLYATTSCYYNNVSPFTPFPAFNGFGTFTAAQVAGCFNDVHIVAVSPALSGSTDLALSGWSCSVHNVFDSFPSTFIPLAIANSVTGGGSLTFADSSFGIPYVLVRGASPILCGDGINQVTEECDDGNTDNGDGCNSLCKLEECGNGVTDAGEDCDDGNNLDGDTCPANCLFDIVVGTPPPPTDSPCSCYGKSSMSRTSMSESGSKSMSESGSKSMSESGSKSMSESGSKSMSESGSKSMRESGSKSMSKTSMSGTTMSDGSCDCSGSKSKSKTSMSESGSKSKSESGSKTSMSESGSKRMRRSVNVKPDKENTHASSTVIMVGVIGVAGIVGIALVALIVNRRSPRNIDSVNMPLTPHDNSPELTIVV